MKENSILLQPDEEIKPIVDYEGLYSVTSKGRIRSHEKTRKGKNNSQRRCEAKFLKPQLDTYGYLKVNLYKDNEKKTYRIHRLEAIAFINNPLNHSQVNHKDTNKQNNYVGTAAKNYEDGNLEWCNSQENMDHAMKNGLFKKETSKFYGVYFNKGKGNKNKPWKIYITIDKKQKYIGCFKTEVEAAQAYNEYVIKHNLNRPLNKLLQ